MTPQETLKKLNTKEILLMLDPVRQEVKVLADINDKTGGFSLVDPLKKNEKAFYGIESYRDVANFLDKFSAANKDNDASPVVLRCFPSEMDDILKKAQSVMENSPDDPAKRAQYLRSSFPFNQATAKSMRAMPWDRNQLPLSMLAERVQFPDGFNFENFVRTLMRGHTPTEFFKFRIEGDGLLQIGDARLRPVPDPNDDTRCNIQMLTTLGKSEAQDFMLRHNITSPEMKSRVWAGLPLGQTFLENVPYLGGQQVECLMQYDSGLRRMMHLPLTDVKTNGWHKGQECSLEAITVMKQGGAAKMEDLKNPNEPVTFSAYVAPSWEKNGATVDYQQKYSSHYVPQHIWKQYTPEQQIMSRLFLPIHDENIKNQAGNSYSMSHIVDPETNTLCWDRDRHDELVKKGLSGELAADYLLPKDRRELEERLSALRADKISTSQELPADAQYREQEEYNRNLGNFPMDDNTFDQVPNQRPGGLRM